MSLDLGHKIQQLNRGQHQPVQRVREADAGGDHRGRGAESPGDRDLFLHRLQKNALVRQAESVLHIADGTDHEMFRVCELGIDVDKLLPAFQFADFVFVVQGKRDADAVEARPGIGARPRYTDVKAHTFSPFAKRVTVSSISPISMTPVKRTSFSGSRRSASGAGIPVYASRRSMARNPS